MKKFRIAIECVILVMLFARIVRASQEVPFEQLSSQHSVDTVRSAKSQEIRKYINETADPCENFYEFVCGYWNKINPATSMENPTTGFMVSLLKSIDHKLRQMLLDDNTSDTLSDRTVKNFYQSCLQVKNIQDSYSDKLKQIVGEFGEMPAWSGGNWQEGNFDGMQTVARIAHKYDIKIIIDLVVGKAIIASNETSLFIDQPIFYLPSKELYLDRDNNQVIREYQRAIAFNLNKYLQLEEAEAQRTAKEIVEFETALVEGVIDQPMGKPFSEVYDLSTLEEVHRKYSADFNMEQQINLTIGIIPNFKVYTNRVYIQNLIKVLRHTPKRVLANYIFYQLVQRFIFQLPDSNRQLEDSCMVSAKTYFIMHLDNMIYRRYSTRAVEKGIANMWLDIKSSFKRTLQSQKLHWIQEDTRRLALEKLKEMKLEFVSYEQQIATRTFGQLSLNKLDYVENLKALLTLKGSKERAKLTEINSASAYADFWSPNPYYMFDENSVKIPASIMLPYYTWSASFAQALNFGMLGSMLSHEVIHGFDQMGSNYNAQGHEFDWWDTISANAFKDRTKCFIDQYRQYIFGDRRLPEMSDQGENIADNGGIRLAYDAYLQWLTTTSHLKEERIERVEYMPGLDHHYSSKQLFFISYAHMWCSDTFADFRNIQTSLDVHVPAEFRVIGPLSNLKEFSEAFNCPKGSGMNPIKKCEIY